MIRVYFLYIFLLFSCVAQGALHPTNKHTMTDEEYENYMYNVYVKNYKHPITYEKWSEKIKALSQKNHKLKYKDNLWDLSKVYFQDHLYWSKLWVANQHITNPHRIKKDNTIEFNLKNLTAVNTLEHSVDLKEQFPNVKVPPQLFTRKALSEGEIPLSLPPIHHRLSLEAFTSLNMDLLKPVAVNSQIPLPFYLSEDDVPVQGVIQGKDGYGLVATNGEDVIIFYEGELSIGQQYVVFENKGSFSPSLFRFSKGYEIEMKGHVEILGYFNKSDSLYRARVTESLSPLKEGDKITGQATVSYDFSEGSSGVVQGQIIGTPHKDRNWLDMMSFVYLDKGSQDGVNINDVYYIKMGNQRNSPYSYKPYIGKMKVVHTDQDVSTALITQSRDAIHLGDFFLPNKETVLIEESPDHESMQLEGLREEEIVDDEFSEGQFEPKERDEDLEQDFEEGKEEEEFEEELDEEQEQEEQEEEEEEEQEEFEEDDDEEEEQEPEEEELEEEEEFEEEEELDEEREEFEEEEEEFEEEEDTSGSPVPEEVEEEFEELEELEDIEE